MERSGRTGTGVLVKLKLIGRVRPSLILLITLPGGGGERAWKRGDGVSPTPVISE